MSDVYITIDNRKVNGKSIMGVVFLGLAPNTEITLTVNVSDEKELLEELTRFFNGENLLFKTILY
ncbi:HPr family phosphocarrier protein [Halalkalibacter flavus]|uniref:HPr family phosphocarrier protein n=1 Tax=Halalkalibacter flavus TaxID=3090668 RepID=UPI003D675B19